MHMVGHDAVSEGARLGRDGSTCEGIESAYIVFFGPEHDIVMGGKT
ncbi:MAG: hypothetical protein MJY56_07045 [Bacteroidales bacterium]|nr:hypothetical protein [Bacteroidales bacterium]